MKKKVSLIIICNFLICFIFIFSCNTQKFLYSSNNIYNFDESNIKMQKAALVLEGGSLRSVYTSGVLDVFMENGIQFDLIVAVSAGALNAGNFVSNQIGRSAKINILHSDDSNYYGYKQLIFHRRAFNFEYIFYSPINDLYPYDEEALKNSKQRLMIATTNIETGNVEYFERNTYDELVHVLQASSSIPLMSQPVDIEGNLYLDGAIADPIGLHKALSEEYEKVIVVLTNHAEYRMKQPSWFEKVMISFNNRKYPKLMETIRNRYLEYNLFIDEINEMEQNKQIFVIRPNHEINIKTMEKDARKLIGLYFQGRNDASILLPRMIEYIEQNSLVTNKMINNDDVE